METYLPRRATCFLLFFFLVIFGFVRADLQILSGGWKGRRSETCTFISYNSPRNATSNGINLTFVSENFCEPGNYPANEYAGVAVEVSQVTGMCPKAQGVPAFTAMVEIYRLALLNNVSVVIGFQDSFDSQLKVPGHPLNLYTQSPLDDRIPWISCTFLSGMQVDYAKKKKRVWGSLWHNITSESQSSSRSMVVKFAMDDNVWVAMYDSPLYFIFLRLFGLFNLYSTVLAWGFLSAHRKKTKKRLGVTMPQMILYTETFANLFITIHVLWGSFMGDSTYPWWMSQGFITQLAGFGLATTVISGLYFKRMKIKMKNMQNTGGMADFAAETKSSLWLYVIFCVLSDVMAAATIMSPGLNEIMGNFMSTIALLNTLIMCGLFFWYVYQTRSFLRVSMKTLKMGQSNSTMTSNSTRMLTALTRKASWLFKSTWGMGVYFCLGVALGLSGHVIYGLWSPLGWALIGFFTTWQRWWTSFCQIMMVSPYGSNSSWNCFLHILNLKLLSVQQFEDKNIKRKKVNPTHPENTSSATSDASSSSVTQERRVSSSSANTNVHNSIAIKSENDSSCLTNY